MSISKLAVSLIVLLSLASLSLVSLTNIESQAQTRQQPSKACSEIEGALTINAQGFNNSPVDLALFKSSNLRIPYRQQQVTTIGGKATVTFNQIPLGDYAIKASTAGKNHKVKLTAMTYSKNEDRIFGPFWKQGLFHMNKAEMTVVITAAK
jgi:hypothetical protein